jgi:Trypsin-like peptidase domain
MRILGDSIGFIVAAVLILGLLGLAAWSVYAARKAVEELTVHQRPTPFEKHELINRPASGRPSEDQSWKQVARNLEQRLNRLEQAQKMPQNIARDAASSVALVIGEYIWTDRKGRRPLRYAGLDGSGIPLRDSRGNEIVGVDGQGPFVIREFSGTGFLLASGEVLTSGFILSPWQDDPLLEEPDGESEEPDRLPSIRLLHAYFPDSPSAVDLTIEHPDEKGETVLCSIKGERPSAPGLQFSKAGVETGEALVSIGYPGGVALMAARVPDDVRKELFRFPATATDELAQFLAEHGLIQPVVTQARITAKTDKKIFYNMVNSLGNTGGPLLNAEGKVVAMSEATNSDLPGLNLALAVK